MTKKQTGRVIIHFPYRSNSTQRTYNAVLLGLERHHRRYSLPGGQFDSREDRDTLDTALRELEEEFGLQAQRKGATRVFTYQERTRAGVLIDHDIYTVDASGTLRLDTSELQGVGFFNAGKHNQIPASKLERHVHALRASYFGSKFERTSPSRINIPGFYFVGNTDPKVIDWVSQRRNF